MNVALLNPPVEAAVCQKMLGIVGKHIADNERKVTQGVLDREDYLQRMGGLIALRAALKDMETEYRRNFEI